MRISDWSSDVCSSDLSLERALGFVGFAEVHRLVGVAAAGQLAGLRLRFYPMDGRQLQLHALFVAVLMEELAHPEIGRAPCRERVCTYVWISVVAVSLKKKRQHH